MARLDKQFESAKTEWETPMDLFGPLDAEFGFTLDVAADANNTKCKKHFSVTDDGLSQEWSGVCWCNPPYGRDMYKWVRKAASEADRGVTSVLLIPVRSNTQWWHDYCIPKAEVRFVKGRPKFGGATEGLPWPLAIVIFRPNV
jgi:phage N-6-adenine-methyltransferase